MARVARFNVTPVKSTSLLHPDEIFLDAHGVADDRRFLFVDRDGRRFSGVAKARLLGIAAAWDEQGAHLELALPDGSRLRGAVEPVGEAYSVALYDGDVRVRTIGGPFADAVSAHVGEPVRLARVEYDGRAQGMHPVSIVSLASVAELGRRAGADAIPDPRRFRMLVELDECSPHEEDAWTGCRLRLGDAQVQVGSEVPRCQLTNLDPDSGEQDFPTLEVLSTYRRRDGKLTFGVYADVVEPGTVRVGDAVEVL